MFEMDKRSSFSLKMLGPFEQTYFQERCNSTVKLVVHHTIYLDKAKL
jgi:hypothetical protein